MSNVHRLNQKDYVSLAGNHLNFFEITGRDATKPVEVGQKFNDWHSRTLDVGEFKVIPFGSNNDIPKQVQEAVLPNHLAPRLQAKKVELLFEQGPYLYTHQSDGTRYFRQPENNPQILQWLQDIDHEELLLHCATEYYYQNAVYTKVVTNRGSRISTNGTGIAELKPMTGYDCRLAYRKNDKRKTPTHIVVGDWDGGDEKDYEVYPIFDKLDPTRYPVSIHVAKFGTYGIKHYPLPDIWGGLEWIRRSTSIPKVFKALTENALNIKWHIQSPNEFWLDKRKILMDNCKATGKKYKESMLEDLKKEILDKLGNMLSGVENVGKFWHNEYVVKLIGGKAYEHGWKITPIEQKILEYVKAQIEISLRADFATVASLGVHSALGNVGADGKSDSGSEQLYALKIHQITSTQVPEMIVCKAINDMLRIKFNTDIRIGFYHLNPEREQDITKSQRIANQDPTQPVQAS